MSIENNKIMNLADGKVLYDDLRGRIAAKHDVPSGGASGKFLKKASATDYDLEWGDAATDEQVAEAVDDWLDENVAQETGYVLDRSLLSSNAAAPADMVGDLKSAFDDLEEFCRKSIVTITDGSISVASGTDVPAQTHLVDVSIANGDTYKFKLDGNNHIATYHLYANGDPIKYNCASGTEYTLEAESAITWFSIYCAGANITGSGTVTGTVTTELVTSGSLESQIDTLTSTTDDLSDKVDDLEEFCHKELDTTVEGSMSVTANVDVGSQTHLIDVSIANGKTFKFKLYSNSYVSSFHLYANGDPIKYNCTAGTEYSLTASSNITWLSIYCAGSSVTGSGTITCAVTLAVETSNSLEARIDTLGGSISGIEEITNALDSIIDADVVAYFDEYEVGASVNNDGNATYIYHDIKFNITDNDMVGAICTNVVGATADKPISIYQYDTSNAVLTSEHHTLAEAKNGIIVSPVSGAKSVAVRLYASTTGGLTTTTAKFYNVNVFKNNTGRFTIKNDSVPDPYAVPFYYLKTSYLQNKINTIEGLMSAANGNYDAFVFCTDQHWTLNAKQSPKLMNYICQRLNIPRMFMGGDYADGINLNALKAYRDGFTGKIYDVIGNHEYMNYFADIGKEFVSKTIADGDIWAYINMHMTDAVSGNYGRNYYYVDNAMQKMRYIILSVYADNNNSATAQFETDQKNWFQNTALNLPSGYTAVVFAHFLYSVDYDTGEMTASSITEEIEAVVDAYSGNGEIACMVAGHTHVDGMTATTGGIPVFITTCDKYLPWIENNVDMEPWLTENRQAGTITEQAFDVVVINKTSKLVSFVRIGAPADNGTEDKLEIRQKYYGT